MFKRGSRGFEPKDNRLPEDARIVDAKYDPLWDTLTLTIESATFEKIQPMAIPPLMEEPTFVCKDFANYTESMED